MYFEGMFRVCHALLSLAGKGLTSWFSCMSCLFVFCHFPMWCPGHYRFPIFAFLLTILS